MLSIKDCVRSSINDFRERIRAITNPSFAVGRLNLRRKKMRKMLMNNRKITVAVYFTYFESIIVYRSTRSMCSVSERA